MKKRNFNVIAFIMLLVLMGFAFSSPVYARLDNQFSHAQADGGGSGGGGGSSTDETETTDDKAWLTSSKVSCGPVTNIPAKVPEIFSLLILLFEIAVPVILVIIGMIDLSKGVMSQKEDEIKKGQQTFIKRLIAGALIFFIVALVKLLVGVVGGQSGNKIGIVDCMDCFLNGECTEMGTGSSDDPTLDDPTDPNTSMENFH